MTELKALEQYKVEQSPNEIKSNHLKSIYESLVNNKKLNKTPLNLSKQDTDKLNSRFDNEKLSDISIQAIIIGLSILNESDFRAEELSKACKLSWTQLSLHVSGNKNALKNESLLHHLDSKDHKIPVDSFNDYNQTANSDVIWHRADCYQVMLYLYGAERIDFIERAWQDMVTRSFQTGWERRSFRLSADHIAYLENRLAFLRVATLECKKGWRDGSYILPKLETVRWAWEFWHTNSPLEWSAEIDMAGESGTLEDNELFNLMRDIIYNRDEGDSASGNIGGKVSREIIQALLASKQLPAWELVKDLLLTAQRQEGLRQTILEALDEGSREAIAYFIDVILEHNLTRFSSVVRAVDVWTGMVWQADKATACKKFLQSAKAFFDNPKLLEKKIDSQNNLDVLSALWVTSIDDVTKTVPMIEELIKAEKIEKVALAMYFVRQWDLPELEMPLYLSVIRSEKLSNNLLSLGSALTPLVNRVVNQHGANHSQSIARLHAYQYNQDNQDNSPQLYTQLQTLLKQSEVKEKTFDGKIFSWLSVQYQREHIYQLMGALAIADNTQFKNYINEYKEELSLNTRENLTRQMQHGSAYDFNKRWVIQNRSDVTELSDIQRFFAMSFIDDRGEQVGNVCAKMLIRGKLTAEELPQVEALFSNKGKLLSKRLLYVMLGQEGDIALTMAENLLASDNTQQRVAGLELALELSQDDSKDCISKTDKTKISHWIEGYEDNLPKAKNGKTKKLTKAETDLLARFEMVEEGVLSAENGWGLYDPNNVSPYNEPVFDENGYFPSIAKLPQTASNKGKYKFGLSKSRKKIMADLELLKQTYLDNADFEYETPTYDGGKETVLLGNYFRSTEDKLSCDDGLAYFESYPLWQTWLDWYKQVQWTARDLFIVLFEIEESYYYRWQEQKPKEILLEKFPEFFPNIKNDIPKLEDDAYHTPLTNVLEVLNQHDPFVEKHDYLISACQSFYSQLDSATLNWQRQEDDNSYYSNDKGDGWQSMNNAGLFLTKLDNEHLTAEQSIKVWHLYRWWQRSGLKHNINHLSIPLEITAKAYKAKLINDDELTECVVNSSGYSTNISWLSNLTHERIEKGDIKAEHPIHDAPELWDILNKVREYCLDIELKRGETETPVSRFVAQFNRFYGVNRLVEAITALGKKNLYANYMWNVENGSKTQMMSYIVAKCYPLPTDTQESFDKAVREANLSEDRLVQIAIYAPQWQSYVENHLNWDGLASGIWWMNAHTKTSEYESKSAQEESEIAKYSTIDLNEFKRGAVDIDWFNQAYHLLGKKRWAILYDCAKFVSDGNGHRRAKLYSDVLTGELKIREVTKKVKDKRDQDFVRLYGLVPLSKTNAEKDVLTRYTYLQQFKKESRQFGSQRQASEGLSVQVAMDNLARTAGYPDPLRLGWAMESKTVQEIFAVKKGKSETKVELDDTTIELVIDDNGKSDIIVSKAGKKQKSIPAKYRKHADVEQLKKHKKTLTEQFRRAKTSLEDSMVRGDVFTAKELGNLFEHPVISKLLAKLVFVSVTPSSTLPQEEREIKGLGFYQSSPPLDNSTNSGELEGVNGKLINYANESTDLQDDDQLRIAHCVDLHEAGEWRAYQTYCFDNELKQPFKQIFRELYLPTPDELAEKTISRRYAGHQVQPAKTVALLKGRGWRVDYEEGLQKVYHKAGFRVKLYAMADWFSPADTESPTLETVEFHRLRRLEATDDTDNSDDKKLSYNVPFDEVDPRIFSEVMRDIDLVVSVAHVGEVDPEASQSSIELRAVLLAETVRLFKLDNVEIKGKHALIDGTMAKYSVHLGSAVAHQVAGSYLSILPVHSQHRGRLFLPFMDDDPKTAELMAKVLLLAKDNEIQDPTVLSQIKMK